jgi:3-deoxy-D-manno-octulosonate 8-phosphate phosphatase KdsC-like HAD superfamily phosphatase
VDYVSRAVGGDGAAREFVELVLKAQGRWEGLIASYVGDETPAVNAATRDDTR